MFSVNDGIIPQNLALSLNKKWKHAKYSFGWKSNVNHSSFAHWHNDIVDGSLTNKTDLSANLLKFPEESEVWEILQKGFLGPSDLLRCYVNAYTFGTEGAPHTDGNVADEQTTIIYLNQEWKAIWAGETVVFDETKEHIILSALPKLGRMFSFPSNYWHAARPISKSCPDLRMVLVFKGRPRTAKEETISDKEASLFTWLAFSGTKNIPHSKGTLYDHLLGTHQILKNEGASEDLCLAGLFHSIYGTSIYQSVTTDNREVIKGLIGAKAEEMVYVFSILDRPNCWQYNDEDDCWPQSDGNYYMIGKEMAKELRWLEKANLQEQKR